jgi:hypothetical protein
MNKKVQDIISHFSNKELSFGCLVELENDILYQIGHSFNTPKEQRVFDRIELGEIIVFQDIWTSYPPEKDLPIQKRFEIKKVIGHPVHLRRILLICPKVNVKELVALWREAGIDKSLNELVNDKKAKKLFDFLDTLY